MTRFTIAVVFSVTSLAFAQDAPFYADKMNLMQYIDASGTPQPVEAIPGWNIRRGHILANMQMVMGPFPDHPKPDFDIEIVGEVEYPTYIQREITFVVEPGDRLPAYLLMPKNLTGKTAGILALHQTYAGGKEEPAGVSGTLNRHYGQELAERGYVVLAPDYPGYGDYKIDVYAMGYASATMKGIWNHMRCVDLLQSLPEVDPERIGAIGHSLGGHNTLYVGAFDPRIKVMVTSCGFNRFAKYYGGNLKGWSHQGYMPRILSEYDADPAKMPFDFTEILGVLAPRTVFINAPINDANFEVSGVKDCVTAATPVFELYSSAHKLLVAYPEAEHDFPPAQRSAAYQVMAEVLGE